MKTAVRHVSRGREVIQCVREVEGWRKLILAYVGLSSLPLPHTAHTRSGTSFCLEEFYDAETLWQIYCRGVYEVRSDDRVIVDAGANIGLFVCYAAARAPRAVIHAFEPVPATYERLARTVRENGLAGRVTCHQCALHSTAGLGRMSAAGPASQMFRLAGSDAQSNAIAVPTRTLAQVVEDIPAAEIDLLKMDIEGSEYPVLMTAREETLRRFRRITIEFHESPTSEIDKRRLADHVCRAGFSLREDPDATGSYGIFNFVKTV